jgi:hypothetical protein
MWWELNFNSSNQTGLKQGTDSCEIPRTRRCRRRPLRVSDRWQETENVRIWMCPKTPALCCATGEHTRCACIFQVPRLIGFVRYLAGNPPRRSSPNPNHHDYSGGDVGFGGHILPCTPAHPHMHDGLVSMGWDTDKPHTPMYVRPVARHACICILRPPNKSPTPK